MILKQYYLGCLAHASYLIADEGSGEAAVVDPQRDVEQYLEDARRLGCRIARDPRWIVARSRSRSTRSRRCTTATTYYAGALTVPDPAGRH